MIQALACNSHGSSIIFFTPCIVYHILYAFIHFFHLLIQNSANLSVLWLSFFLLISPMTADGLESQAQSYQVLLRLFVLMIFQSGKKKNLLTVYSAQFSAQSF